MELEPSALHLITVKHELHRHRIFSILTLTSGTASAPVSGFSPFSTAAANMMISPDGMTRAFSRQLDGRQTGHQAMPPPSMANHRYVYVPQYGPMPILSMSTACSDAAAPLSALPAPTAAGATAAFSQYQPSGSAHSVDALLNLTAIRGVVRDMPLLKSLRTIGQMWQLWVLWDEGSAVDMPIK